MRSRRTVIVAIAATAAIAVAVALGVYLWPHGHHAKHPSPALDSTRVRELTDGYRRDTVARLPARLTYTEAVRAFVACPGAPGRYLLSSRYDLMPESTAPSGVLGTLRRYWRQRGYRIVNDTPGLTPQLLVEDPADGFRLGISQRTARYLRLAVSSPCLSLAVAPESPLLLTDLAAAQGAYERYVAGLLGQLAGDVAALRTAVASGDTAQARAAWLTAQLRWERVGAAYGTFGDLSDAIDGLAQGLAGGTADPGFTGLHRVEYGLWHGEPAAGVLRVVDRLAADVVRLRATLDQVAPEPADLPLRVHEILEDAQRDHLTGLTDYGAGAGLAETWADVDATQALLDVYAPLLTQRRPALLPAIRINVDGLRRALSAARTGTVSPGARERVNAALGAVLENLASVPGLLEMAQS
jgi:hypothetical protein